MPLAEGVAYLSTANRRVPVLRSVRPEPSWGRVLLTTVELWVSRRLRPRGLSARPRGRALLLAVAAVAAVAVALAAFQLADISSRAVPRTARPSAAGRPAAHRVPAPPAVTAQSEAAAWIASQVSNAAIIGCYPALCASLQALGVEASRLMPLGPELAGVLRVNVIATLSSAGRPLADQYAPALIASFGSGGSQVEVRAVAPDGAAAYRSALRADLASRKSAGSELLGNGRIGFRAADSARLRAGEVDSRLLVTLAALSSQFTLRVTAFGDASPGAPVFYRSVTVASGSGGNSAAWLAAARAMVSAQQNPYRPAHCVIARPKGGQSVLRIDFAAPGPLGLLTAVLTADRQ